MGIAETVKIRQYGFPIRYNYEEFQEKFGDNV